MFRSRKSEGDTPTAETRLSEEMMVIVDRAVHPLLVLFHDPSGYRAEQFRGLRNKLIAMNPDGAAKSLVVTSAIRGEGKTVTAINLAMAFAELERTPVLLVDGDLRSSAVESFLNLNSQRGLADVLLGHTSLDKAIRQTGIKNLCIIGSGTKLTGPSEIITAPKVQELFDRLKERFLYVIVDTPPVLPSTDASVMAARADGCIAVVRLEHSSKTLTREAIRNLQDLGANMLGTFLTEVRGHDPEADRRLADGADRES